MMVCLTMRTSGMGCKHRGSPAPDASGAIEVEEAAGAKVHPLLALAVVVQAELLRLQMHSMAGISSCHLLRNLHVRWARQSRLRLDCYWG